MKAEPHADYKPTGEDWLQQVPTHWEAIPLRQLGRFLKGSGGSKDDALPTGLPCIRYGDLYTTHRIFIRRAVSCISPSKACEYTPIRTGDALFAASGETIAEIGKSAVNLLESPACCGGDVVLLRPKRPVEPGYLGYALECRPVSAQKSLGGRGITVMHVYPSYLKGVVIPLPPLSEQTTIARFLDHVDLRIQRCIRAKEKLIALLEEQKQAVIHQAVTGQIDVRTGKPYPAYKDSGVGWIGKVPAHWGVTPLKWVACRSQTGATPPTSEERHYEDGTVPWYGPSSCGVADEAGPPVRHLNQFAFERGGARLVAPPAILIIVIGATAGRMALMSEAGSTNQQITAFELSANRVNPLFLLRQLRLSELWLRFTASTATIPILDSDAVAGLPCAIPPLSEQTAINSFLDHALTGVDSLDASTRRLVTMVQEYRARLIADVVTGKLDVREAAAKLPDVDPLEDDGMVDGHAVSSAEPDLDKPKTGSLATTEA